MNRKHNNRLMQRAWMLIAGSCVWLGLDKPALAEVTIAFNRDGLTTPTVTVPLTDVLSKNITFRITGSKNIPSKLYAAFPRDKEDQACPLIPVPHDSDLFQPQWDHPNCKILTSKGRLGRFKIKFSNPEHVMLVEFEPPNDKGGPRLVGKSPYHFRDIDLQSECYVHNGTEWQPVKCLLQKTKGSSEASGDLANFITQEKDKLVLYASVGGGSGHVWYQVTVPADPPIASVTKFEDDCKAEIAKGNLEDGPMYVLCADVRDPYSTYSLLYIRETTSGNFIKAPHPTQIKTGMPVVVYAWHAPGECPIITPDGEEGLAPRTYDTVSVRKEGVEPATCAGVVRKDISSQKGALLKVSIKVTRNGQERGHERTFLVEKQYHTAIRLGLGVSWSPWAREVEARNTSSGTNYAAVTQGGGLVPGLFETETILGFSYFFKPMSDLRPEWHLGLNAGLGIWAASDKGLKGLTSLRAGVEYNYGVDFSFGVTVGVNRHDLPEDGFAPGQALPNGVTEIKEHFGLTPGVGFFINMTPGVLKNAFGI